MKKEMWATINEIVDEALNRDKENREAYIHERCGNDKQLLKEVSAFLESVEKSKTEQFLETPSDFMTHLADDLYQENSDPSGSVLLGETIGKYKITELIEHGGMGSVFAAERTDEAYHKKVALKLLRRGMDTPSNIARFKRERNILANLDHPNITRLLDGGVTKDGLPYLVMDYVNGTPLFEYCDRHQLSIEERLEIFKTICQAVQHAHKKAVIHRDLKPSNILITDEGLVKVLDFGIAKLLEEEAFGGDTFRTRSSARFLTLRYSAPEQVESRSVTTSTDTYTLGILLYELLAGVHPFSEREKGFLKMEKLIRERQPEKPSVRYNQLPAEKRKKIAHKRSSSPNSVQKELKDELDAIVMKSLRKEQEMRYQSVEQFLDDLHRREHNQPVSAREDTLRYKTSKFIRRRKKELSVAAVLLLVLTGSVIYHTWKIAQERNIARAEARKADQISFFLLDLFETEPENDTLSAASLLQEGMAHTQEVQDPEAHSVLMSVMGQAYMNFGNYERAGELLHQSVKENKQAHGEESTEYASALYRLGLLQSSQYNWDEAEQSFRRSCQILTGLLGEGHPKTIDALSHLAVSLRHLGELEAAEEYSREAVNISRRLYEPTHSNMISAEANLAYVLRERNKPDEAIILYERVISNAESNGAVEEEQLAIYHNNFGYLLRQQQEYRKAIEQYRQALVRLENSYVGGHPRIINTRRNLATVLHFEGESDAAEELLLKNVSAIRDKHSTRHWRTASALNSMGVFYLENQQYESAEQHVRESTRINQDVLGKDHLWTAYSEGLLAASLFLQDKNSSEADSLYRHHYQLYENNRSDLNRNNRRHINKLKEMYEINFAGESKVEDYERLLR